MRVLFFIICALFSCISAGQAQDSRRVLNIFNWDEYLVPASIEAFEKEYGVRVEITPYNDEDEMLAVMMGEPHRFDLVITGQTVLQQMIDMRMLAPLDSRVLSSIGRIDERFRNTPFDAGNRYSVPYMWGTIRVLYNKEKVVSIEKGWDILWDAAYKGRIGMLDTPFEAVYPALLSSGYSSVTVDLNERKKAWQKAIDQEPLVGQYADVRALSEGLRSGDLWLALMYNGDAVSLARENSRFAFFIPAGRVVLWFDSFAIPRDSKDKDLAEDFILFMMRPEQAALGSNDLLFATCNKDAYSLIHPENWNDPAIYPPQEIVNNGELIGGFDSEMVERVVNETDNRYWADLHISRKGRHATY